MNISDSVLDELLKDCKNPQDLTGENGILKQLTKRLLERAMSGEMSAHLGYDKHALEGRGTGNSRNGTTSKIVKGEFGEVTINTPRDRNGDFEPKVIKKNQTRFDGFDAKILAMYSFGMSTRDIQENLKEIYGVDISPDLVSQVTDVVIEDVKEWQSRTLERIYPIVYLDALRTNIRDQGQVKNKSVYTALGINLMGKKEVLGLWIDQTEGAKFWLNVLTQLKNRGVEKIYVACVDGLKGFPEAIKGVFPETEVQLCLVHMVRHSLVYVGSKDKKNVSLDLKKIYTATTEAAGLIGLEEFSKKYDAKYPIISKSWKNNWSGISTFFKYPPEIRRIIYTTNAIEAINSSLRKSINNKGSFPTDEAALKMLYLKIIRLTKKWNMPVLNWGLAMNQFMIRFSEDNE